MQETQVWALCQADPLEKWIATHPTFLPGEFHGQRSLVGYSPWRHRVGHNWVTNTYTLYWYTLKVMQENIIILLEKALCILQHSEGENRPIFIQIFIISDVWYLIWNKNFLLSAFASALRTSFSIFFFILQGCWQQIILVFPYPFPLILRNILAYIKLWVEKFFPFRTLKMLFYLSVRERFGMWSLFLE